MKNHTILKSIVFYASIVTLMISITYKASYAYFSAQVVGNETTKNTAGTAANIDVTFTTTSYINNEKLKPLLTTEIDENSSKVEFIVTNTIDSNVPIYYDIYLEDFIISDNFAASEDVKWKLTTVLDDTETYIIGGNFHNAITGTKYRLTTTNETLDLNSSKTYRLRLWIEETDVPQDCLLEGSISGRVSVIGKISK